jgi:hypothetical protein
MRYLAISLDKGSIIVEVDVCRRCFHFAGSTWWKHKLWQHPTTGKVHSAESWTPGRTECGIPFPSGTRIADKTVAVNVS